MDRVIEIVHNINGADGTNASLRRFVGYSRERPDEAFCNYSEL
jgi:hypothetical protein